MKINSVHLYPSTALARRYCANLQLSCLGVASSSFPPERQRVRFDFLALNKAKFFSLKFACFYSDSDSRLVAVIRCALRTVWSVR